MMILCKVMLCNVLFCSIALLASTDPVASVYEQLARGAREVRVPKGTYVINPADGAESYFRFSGLKDVTVDFGGSELRGKVRTRMFDIEGCTNLTVRNVVIDYDELPFTQARIECVDGDGNWDVRVLGGYPRPGSGAKGGGLDNHDDIWPIQAYDAKSRELKNPMRFRGGVSIVRTGDDTYRITGGLDRRGDVGDIAVWSVKEAGRAVKPNCIEARKCANLVLEDIAEYSTPHGIAFVDWESSRTTYRRCRIVRRPPESDYAEREVPRLRSGNHDAFISKNAYVGPHILDCVAEYHCDDCVNISGAYQVVYDGRGDTLRVFVHGKWDLQLAPGDACQLLTPGGLTPPDVKVVAIEPGPAIRPEESRYLSEIGLWPGIADGMHKSYLLRLDRSVNLPRGTLIASTRRMGDGFLIRGCRFGSTRARGLLLKASHGRVEDCRIDRDVSISTEYEWLSAGIARDIVFTNCTFGSGFSLGGSAASGRRLPSAVNRGITVNGIEGVNWDEALVVGRTNGDKVFYAPGEEMVFTLELKGVRGILPTSEYWFDWKRTANDGKTECGRAPVPGPLVIRTHLDQPGFVKIEANIVDRNGKRVPKKHMWEKRVFFQGGAGVQPNLIEEYPEPLDYDAHWAALKKRVDDMPLDVLERRPFPCANAALDLWIVKVRAPDGVRPMTGYLVIPKGVSAANRAKATGFLSGYYNFAEKCPTWLTNSVNGIQMYVNRHGCELERPKEYYDQFFRSWPMPAEHFRDMAIRGMLMFRYLKTLPEWNGRELEAKGSSGGAMQSIWMGMAVPGITRIEASAPAMADVFGFAYGRPSTGLPQHDEACAYYDIAYAAKRVKCPTYLTAGLGDYTCPPFGLAFVYRNLSGPKQIVWKQGCTHGWQPQGMATLTLSHGLSGTVEDDVERLTPGGDAGNANPLSGIVSGGDCESAKIGYSSLLRVGENLLYDAAAASNLWKFIESHPGAFSELTIFSQINHSVRPLARHERTAEKVGPFLRKAESLGLVAGINVLTTLGFFEDEYAPEMDSLPMAADFDGVRTRGRLCPSSPATLEYVRNLYALFARCRPAFVYVDDDVTMTPCFCDRCLKAFAERHPGLLAKPMTRKVFSKGINSDDPLVRQRVREAWITFCNAWAKGVFEAVEAGVHGVDPQIGLGVMSCSTGRCGLDVGSWTKALRGNTTCEIRWRPGGGVWNDYSVRDMVDKAYRMTAQTRYLPQEVGCVQAEIENFPYMTLRKSPSFMGFEALAYLGIGCTGVAWNFCGFTLPAPEEQVPFFDAASAVAAAGAEIVAACGRTPCGGVAYPWDGLSASMPAAPDIRDVSNVPQPIDLAMVGIPVATDPAHACVTLLDASSALRLTDAALVRVLSGGVFMDADALAVVNRRGFSKLTGFGTAGTAPRDAITRDLVHPLNLDGCRLRDLRTAFGWHAPIVLLEKTDNAAQYTESATSLLGEAVGYAGGIFENARGGRVAVETMLPFSFCESKMRSVHLKRLFRWLSRDALPSYLASHHRAAVFDRNGKWFVVNLATEAMRGGELAVRCDGALKATVFDGGKIVNRTQVPPGRREGAYTVCLIPDIPAFGCALIRP